MTAADSSPTREQTWCEDCEFCIPNDKYPRMDMCMKHPRLSGHGFVRRNTWTNAEPYLYCRDVNAGACPLWKRKRNEQIEAEV